ncbi:MAG: hypothetical protein DHS20C11_19420 [Lysobacteraceae bacterium]|nr:MAG: hypothetical protein DHS20C11_19420 [Xanthomonadaceae bacterium]
MNRIVRLLAPLCVVFFVVHVEAAEAEPALSQLVVDDGTGANVVLTPAFSPSHLTYSAAVASDVYRVQLLAAPSSDEVVRIRGRALQADTTHSIDLPFAGTAYPVPIEVIGPGLKSVTYQLSVRRLEGCAEPNRIVLANGSLRSEFDVEETKYQGVVPPGEDTVQVIAFSPCAYSKLSIEGSNERFGQASRPIPLNDGKTIIEVTATAEDQVRANTYQITVERGSVHWQDFSVE